MRAVVCVWTVVLWRTRCRCVDGRLLRGGACVFVDGVDLLCRGHNFVVRMDCCVCVRLCLEWLRVVCVGPCFVRFPYVLHVCACVAARVSLYVFARFCVCMWVGARVVYMSMLCAR